MDMGFLPRAGSAQYELFLPHPNNTTDGWQTWIKPRNASMVMMWCVGAGGGGGGGASVAFPNGGGGGGGSGAVSRLLVPASFLPDTLYILIPRGGAGGAAQSTGTVGGRSFITSDSNHTAVGYRILMSGNNSAAGGVGTSTSTGGAGGAGSAVTNAIDSFGNGLGLWTAVAGQAGVAGGSATLGTDLAWGGAGIPGAGGSGGGGTQADGVGRSGGSNGGGGIIPLLTSNNISGAGVPGVNLFPQFLFAQTGGTGSNGAIAQPGGPGGYGCGGGGGGGNAGAGNAGGKGGDGLVLIVSW